MQRHKSKSIGCTKKVELQHETISDNSFQAEKKKLKREIIEKSQVSYNLCIKFLRMKDARDSLRKKLDSLFQEHLRVMAEMMEKLDEAREELNIIVSEKFQEPLPISKVKILQVNRNCELMFGYREVRYFKF